MRLASHNRTDVLDAIRDINETISLMESELNQQLELADSMWTEARKFRATFSVAGSVVWDLYRASANFNRSAGCRTHDVELVLNEAAGQRLIDQIQLVAFDIELADFKLTATPVGRPMLQWHDPRLTKDDC